MFLKKLLAFAALSCSLLVHVAFAAEDDLQSEHVKQAIHRARNFLLEKQDRVQGNWVSYPSFPGGKTALCTLALLNAGDAPQEPHIARAIAHLRSMSAPKHTYVAALQTMVFCQATPEKDLLLIRRNVELLQEWQIKTGIRKGGWSYSAKKSSNGGDNSNAQFARLAVHEAELAGIDIDRVWHQR